MEYLDFSNLCIIHFGKSEGLNHKIESHKIPFQKFNLFSEVALWVNTSNGAYLSPDRKM